MAALEIMLVNSAISSLIRDGKTHQIQSTMQMGAKAGMKILNDSLAALVAAGTVNPDEAYIKAVDKDGYLNCLRAVGVDFNPANLGHDAEPAEGVSQPAVPDPAAALPSSAPAADYGQPASPPAAKNTPPGGDPFEAYKLSLIHI